MTESTRRYEILDTLGTGAFGTVYRARAQGPEGFSKVVALKMLHDDKADMTEIVARLRDEARILGLLRHRAVVQADGLVRLGGRWAVVMEYVEGVDLRRLSTAHRVPPGVALEIAAEVAGALHIAYTTLGADGKPLRLLHRDVKLANVQITGAGAVKLLDFGIARAEFSGRESETGDMHFGSELYVSPERIDHIYGPEGDVYSLGIVLYHLLMGEHFGKTSANEERHNALHRRRIDTLRAALTTAAVRDDGLADLVHATLAYAPQDRPTAREFERRATELRRTVPGTALRNWAEATVIPMIGASPVRDADRLVGQVFAEGSELTRIELDPDAPPRQTRRRLLVVGGVLAAAAALSGLIWIGSGPSESAAPAAEAALSVPEPVPELLPTPAAAPPAEAAVKTSVSTRATTRTAKSAPKAAAGGTTATAAPTTGTAVVSGDAESVALVSGDRRYGAGAVPPGTYGVYATFPGRSAVKSGTVQVVAGGTVHIVCSATFGRCQVQ